MRLFHLGSGLSGGLGFSGHGPLELNRKSSIFAVNVNKQNGGF
jgi:hypothetical protein